MSNGPNVWVVRAGYGKYTPQFIDGGYVGAGWVNDQDMSKVKSREEVKQVYQAANHHESPYRVGANVGMLAQFLIDINPGDYVITPDADTEWLPYGKVMHEPYYHSDTSDGCPFRHRRKVVWTKQPLRRSELSVPFQNTMKAAKTVFNVSHSEEFLNNIGLQGATPPVPTTKDDPHQTVLNRVLELDADGFQDLVGHLLAAMGFEGTEVTGKPGDGGVDVRGVLSIPNLVKVDLVVQVKRYKDRVVSNGDIKQLRASIPSGGRGAVITTSVFRKDAHDVATEPGFPHIGLIGGHQLVDLLIQHWEGIPPDFRETLGLKPGLVLV